MEQNGALETMSKQKKHAAASQPQTSAPPMEAPRATNASSSSLGQDPELLREFLSEATEHLESIETNALELENGDANIELVHSLFRSFHTLKGLAGFLEFDRFQKICHEVESLLDLARNREMAVSSALIDLMLRSADFLKNELGPIEFADKEEPGHALCFLGLLQELRTLAEGTAPEPEEAPEAAGGPVLQEEILEEAEPAEAAPLKVPEPERAPAAAQSTEAPRERSEAGRGKSFVKVDTSKLDYLVDTVGEMVIAQSLLQQSAQEQGELRPQLSRDLVQLARITDELQKTAMSMRMVPVGNLFQKMVRLVRDLSLKSGKPCELKMQGENTELDRNIVEELADPLLHMVRNSVDHGIEPAEDRKKAGKPVLGSVTLAASHEAGHIQIRVTDDGKGLSRERILAKAIQKGLIAPNATLSDNDVFQMIFHPGFSTAEKVTDVSGRGVGMDVVKRRVQKLRGKIDIESTPGKGSTFLIKLPLTLAIIDGLVVRSAGERYILPLYAVREMIQFRPELLRTVKGQWEMILLREKLLPLIRLNKRLRRRTEEQGEEGILVVVESDGRSFALLVNAVLGKQEVVIKSLGEMFQNVGGLAGAAILGDGRVGLILDVDGLVGEAANA